MFAGVLLLMAFINGIEKDSPDGRAAEERKKCANRCHENVVRRSPCDILPPPRESHQSRVGTQPDCIAHSCKV